MQAETSKISPYTRRLRAMDEELLFDAAKNVAELIEHPGWAFVQQTLDGAEQDAMNRLLIGPTQSGKDVARDLGFIRGVGESVRAAESVLAVAQQVQRELQAKAEAEANG